MISTVLTLHLHQKSPFTLNTYASVVENSKNANEPEPLICSQFWIPSEIDAATAKMN